MAAAKPTIVTGFRFFQVNGSKKKKIWYIWDRRLWDGHLILWVPELKMAHHDSYIPRWGSLRCPKSLYPLPREWYKRFWVVLRCQAWRCQCNRFRWYFWLNGCFWDQWSSCNGGLVEWLTRPQSQCIMGHQGATTIILHLVFTCSMTFWNKWYRTKGLAVQNLQQDV